MSVNFGRCFHAISVRLRPTVQQMRITKWVRDIYSSFPIALVASTSIVDSNLIPRQWLNLGLSRYRWLQLRRINRCKAFSVPVGPNTLTGAPSRTAEPAQNPATNRYSRSEATISSFTKKIRVPCPRLASSAIAAKRDSRLGFQHIVQPGPAR